MNEALLQEYASGRSIVSGRFDDSHIVFDARSGLYFKLMGSTGILWDALVAGVKPALLVEKNANLSAPALVNLVRTLMRYDLLVVRAEAAHAAPSDQMLTRLARATEHFDIAVFDAYADPLLSKAMHDGSMPARGPGGAADPGAAPAFDPHAVDAATVVGYARRVIEQARGAAGLFPRRFTIELPELTAEIHATAGRLADAIEHNLYRGPRANGGAERMTVFIAHPGIAGIRPPAPWVEREPHWPHDIAEILDAARLKASHFFNDWNHWYIYDPDAHTAVQLMHGADDYPPWEPAAPLRLFLHWHYAARGKRLAHCGTLGIGEAGVILAGPGGSGKSGAVLAGLLAGLQSVGDDYVLIEAGADVIAHRLFSTLKQDAAGIRRLGLERLIAPAAKADWQGKYDISFADVSCCDQPAMKIHAILVPRISGSERTAIAPLRRDAAMLALAGSSISKMHGDRDSGFRFFGDVVNRLPCYSLDLGGEPAEAAATIAGFIYRSRP